MKVPVSIVPASGDSQEREIEIDASGCAVRDIRKKAQIDAKMPVSINGEPADDRTHVGPGDKVTFTERAKGS